MPVRDECRWYQMLSLCHYFLFLCSIFNHTSVCFENKGLLKCMGHFHSGLPQGSVLIVVLFNLYTNNLPGIYSWKFIYTDDICLATQAKYFSKLECSLSSDLAWMSHNCCQWRLKPSAAKTVASAFHLHNVSSHWKLQVCLDSQRFMHNPYPKYLGMMLDRTMSLREHLVKTARKVKNRSNLLMKLAGAPMLKPCDHLHWLYAT